MNVFISFITWFLVVTLYTAIRYNRDTKERICIRTLISFTLYSIYVYFYYVKNK